MVLFVLQNAWRRGAPNNGRLEWKERYWRGALWQSHTGHRLKTMIPKGVQYEVCNASPLVGNHSGSIFPPDLEHVLGRIEQYKPNLIVLLGKEAQKLEGRLRSLKLNILVGSHPASRTLTKLQVEQVRDRISNICPS